MTMLQSAMPSRNSAERMADSLGWFSLGLGAVETLAPATLARVLGLKGGETLIRAYGLREIAAGLGILGARNRAPWLWSRVAGDALDVATLAPALRQENRRRGAAAVALAAVLGATLADILGALALQKHNARDERRTRRAVRDYSGRSGYPRGLANARGAARDFKLPRDFRIPEPLRPWNDGRPPG